MGLWLVGSAGLVCDGHNSSHGKDYPCDSVRRKYILHPKVLPNCLQYKLYLELNLDVVFVLLVCYIFTTLCVFMESLPSRPEFIQSDYHSHNIIFLHVRERRGEALRNLCFLLRKKTSLPKMMSPYLLGQAAE